MSETSVPPAERTAVTAAAETPDLELKVAAGISAIPQIAAFLFGGYGHLIVILPVALTLTLADLAAATVAALQLRADRQAKRPTHTLVWIALGLAAPWILYALYVGAVALMVRVFCINETCRGPIR
jgi:hypothetical protein